MLRRLRSIIEVVDYIRDIGHFLWFPIGKLPTSWICLLLSLNMLVNFVLLLLSSLRLGLHLLLLFGVVFILLLLLLRSCRSRRNTGAAIVVMLRLLRLILIGCDH